MDETQKTLTEADLRQFTGGETRYRHPIGRLLYTEGVKYLAEKGGAYWLLDVVGSYQGNPRVKACEPQFWTLTVKDGKGVVVMREDTDTPDIVRQRIPYTDFPLPEARIWVCDGTMLLPSEY